jgi:hypothetical protein
MRRLLVLTVTLIVAASSGAHAEEPYFTTSTAGAPVGTLAGEWEATPTSARLAVNGAVTSATPTTFAAGVEFGAFGRASTRCPAFWMAWSSTGIVAPGSVVDVRPELRYRRPGGKWSAWRAFGEIYVPDRVSTDLTRIAGAGLEPAPTCRGAMIYAWRVRTSVSGNVVLAPMSFELTVKDKLPTGYGGQHAVHGPRRVRGLRAVRGRVDDRVRRVGTADRVLPPR